MWATIEEVQDITGKEFTAETLAVASSIIDIFAGVDESMPADSISALDRGHLRRATAWECFFAAKPGFLTDRENAASLSSDTQSITREDRADVMLHPLARRSLLNLSWIGTRTTLVPLRRAVPPNIAFLNEASDNYGCWKPV